MLQQKRESSKFHRLYLSFMQFVVCKGDGTMISMRSKVVPQQVISPFS